MIHIDFCCENAGKAAALARAAKLYDAGAEIGPVWEGIMWKKITNRAYRKLRYQHPILVSDGEVVLVIKRGWMANTEDGERAPGKHGIKIKYWFPINTPEVMEET